MKSPAFLGAIALTMLGSGQVFGQHSSIQEIQLNRETWSPTPNPVVDDLLHTRHRGTEFNKPSINHDPIIYENKPSVILEKRRVNKPVAKPVSKLNKPAAKPAAAKTTKPGAKARGKQAGKPTAKPAAKPRSKANKSGAKARGKSVGKPIANPGSKANKPGANARGKPAAKSAAKGTKPGAKARGKQAGKPTARPGTKSAKPGATARGKPSKPGVKSAGKAGKAGKASQLAKGRKSQQASKTGKAMKPAQGRQSDQALQSKTRKSGKSTKPAKSRKPGNSKKQNSKAGNTSKPQHKTSKSGSSPKHDKASNRGKGQKQALKTGKKNVGLNTPGKKNKPIGLIKPIGPPKSANINQLRKGSHHGEKPSKTTKGRKKEQASKKDKHLKPGKSGRKSAKSKPTKSSTQKPSKSEKSKLSGPGGSNNYKPANTKPTRPMNGKLRKESKLTPLKSGKQTDLKIGKTNNPKRTKKQTGKGNAPKSAKGKSEKNNQGKLAKQAKNNALTLNRGKPPKSGQGNVMNTGKSMVGNAQPAGTGKHKTTRPTKGNLRGQGNSRNLQSSVTPGKKGPSGQGKSKKISAGGSCLLSRGVSGQAGGSCDAKQNEKKQKEEDKRPVKPESFDPFDKNEKGKQFRYHLKEQTTKITHANKEFYQSDVHREKFDVDTGESKGLGEQAVTKIGFTADGKEAVIPWAMNRLDLPRDKNGRTKLENAWIKGEPTNPGQKAKEGYSKLRLKVSQMFGKPKYDKASLADLVMAVSKKTGNDPSKLENVHLKDITEQDTAARIKEVKKGREKEETILYPNQESKDFEKIHDSKWGKSVQRIVDRIGNKEIESIAIPPSTAAEIHPHLNFKLADRPATESK